VIELILQAVFLVISGTFGYLIYRRMDQRMDDIERKLLKKVSGVPKKDQEKIEQVYEAVKKDVSDAWSALEVNEKVESLEGFPSLQKVVQEDPDSIGSFLTPSIIMDLLLPAIQGGAGSELLQMVTLKNVAVTAAGGVILNAVRKAMSRKGSHEVEDDKDPRKFPQFPQFYD